MGSDSNGGNGNWPRARRGGGRGGSTHIHIQINKDLLTMARSDNGAHLLGMVWEQLLDFDAVNAATGYCNLLLMRTVRDTRARNEALVSLDRVLCDQHVQAVGARQCANTLYALARREVWRPCPDLMRALQSGCFKPRRVL